MVIPAGVTRIGEFAFMDCGGLRSVEIPQGVTHIEEFAFAYCTALTSVVIPEGVEELGAGAFSDCAALTSVVMPKEIPMIEHPYFTNAPVCGPSGSPRATSTSDTISTALCRMPCSSSSSKRPIYNSSSILQVARD